MDNKSNISKPSWKKRTAFFTLVCFFASNLNFSGIPNAHASPISIENPNTTFESINIPASMGQIKNRFHGSRDEIILYIQDAHANEEAQRNIANILNHFSKE